MDDFMDAKLKHNQARFDASNKLYEFLESKGFSKDELAHVHQYVKTMNDESANAARAEVAHRVVGLYSFNAGKR